MNEGVRLDYSHYRYLEVTHENRITTVALNRGELNAIDGAMHEELSQIWRDLNEDEQAEVVILTGKGRLFSAGGDAAAMSAGDFNPFDAHVFSKGRRILLGLLELEAPIIAAVNGPAVGLAATLALLCDIVIADEAAHFADPHVRVGLVAGDGGAAIWPLLCGPARAKQYLMTGDPVPAREAERIGLVNKVADPGKALDEAVLFAETLVALPPLAVRWTKHSVNRMLRKQVHEILDVSLALEAVSIFSQDHGEAVSGFLEKRRPHYYGR